MPLILKPHNDEPATSISTVSERLPLLNHISYAIASCKPPQVFGVHGEWGSGKTSFLCAIQEKLCGYCDRADPNASAPRNWIRDPLLGRRIPVIWFEAWRYQSEQSPVIALLHEICNQLPKGAAFRSKLAKLAFAGFHGLINSVSEVGIGPVKFKNPVQDIQKYGEKYESDHFLTPLTTKSIRKSLNEAVTAILESSKSNSDRVLVIIDDLDRCDPMVAYQLLEGIKIFLNIPSCVFLLGINQRHINRGLGNIIKSEDFVEDTEKRGAEYLEKLCSVIWKLPVATPDSISGLTLGWLIPDLPQRDLNPLPDSLVNEIIRLGKKYDCIPKNPRKLKAFCNSIRSLVSQSNSAELAPQSPVPIPDDHAAVLIVAATIYTFHPELLNRLQSSSAFFEQLLLFSETGFYTLNRLPTAGLSTNHDAFRGIVLPWQKANNTRLDWDQYPGSDDGLVFWIQGLLNHSVGVANILPAEDRGLWSRGEFYDMLSIYLKMPPRN